MDGPAGLASASRTGARVALGGGDDGLDARGEEVGGRAAGGVGVLLVVRERVARRFGGSHGRGTRGGVTRAHGGASAHLTRSRRSYENAGTGTKNCESSDDPNDEAHAGDAGTRTRA